MNTKTRKIVFSAMLCALCCVATMLIKVPSPLKGYVNLGDCVVLLAGWLLSPVYGFLSAGIGSALADIFSGYVLYAPATFIIKGCMAIIASMTFSYLSKKSSVNLSRLVSGILAELFMVLGYLVFESILYGFIPSLVNVLPNVVQGIFGIAIGAILVRIFENNKIIP